MAFSSSCSFSFNSFIASQVLFFFCVFHSRKKNSKTTTDYYATAKKNLSITDAIGNCIMLYACPINQWENFLFSVPLLLLSYFILYKYFKYIHKSFGCVIVAKKFNALW
jgi:hypothetical protein